MFIRATLITFTLALAAPVAADLRVTFDEGAPKDRFTLTNAGGCVMPAGVVTLNLATAPAGLIFDVTAQGAGVEVFQPFELVAGASLLEDTPVVTDGDAAIRGPARFGTGTERGLHHRRG